jgi:putative DNA primase/helicase
MTEELYLTPTPVDTSRITDLCTLYTHHLTDLGNAQRLIALFGDRLRYIISHGWYTFTGTRWQLADSNHLLSLATATLEDHFQQITSLSSEHADLCERVLTHLARSESLPRLHTMLRLARTLPGITLPHTALDSDPYLLNLLDGTLDLRTSTLHPHNPTDFLTRLIPIAYDPLATSSHWHTFLARLTNSDAALQSYLQRAIGSTLFGSSPEATAFLLTGLGHRAHQLLLSLLRALLGDYSTHTLTLQRRDLAPTLLTSRLLTLESSSFPHACDPTILSALLTGNPITTTDAHTTTTYQPRAILWLSAPELPNLPDKFATLAEYFQPIPLALELTGEEAHHISTQLHLALPAILTWAIQGYQSWRTEQSTIPTCLTKIMNTFRENHDSLSSFIAQFCTSSPESSIPAHTLYEAYAIWTRASGERPISLTRFGLRILALGYERSRQARGRLYLGLTLTYANPVDSVDSADPSTTNNSVDSANPVNSSTTNNPINLTSNVDSAYSVNLLPSENNPEPLPHGDPIDMSPLERRSSLC